MKETEKIRAMLIMEIIGKPKDYLVSSLEKYINQIDEEKGVRVLSKDIKEPVLMKESKEFYTTFAEVELDVDDILYLAIVMFKYMPAHIEIISPELIALTNNGWSDILSELIRRLHGYDEVARIMQAEKAILEKKIRELLEEKKGEKSGKEYIGNEEEESNEDETIKESEKKVSKKRGKKKED